MEAVNGDQNQNLDADDNKNAFPRITAKWLRDHCRKHGLYQTPHLNEVLYLQHQGFRVIESLEEYVALKSIWLDHNFLKNLKGLGELKNLKCLFIRNNNLCDLQGIECLNQLVILDASNNQLKNTNGIESLPNLTTLYIGNNKLAQTNCIESLQRCVQLNTVDLSRNCLFDPKTTLDLLKKIEKLSVLYLHGNPVVRNIESYRVQLILHCINLKFLDERPIRENDRYCAHAWLKGGIEEMNKEKKRQKDKEDLEMISNVQGFFDRCKNRVTINLWSQADNASEQILDITNIVLAFENTELEISH